MASPPPQGYDPGRSGGFDAGHGQVFRHRQGFGFIAPEFGGADIFVHVSAVIASGLDQIGEGDFLAFETEQDRRSGRSAAVDLIVIKRGAATPQPSEPRAGIRRAPRDPAGAGTGKVKWFNAAKGFGFIAPDDGREDLFVHVTTLKRAGLDELRDGQPVGFDVEIDRRSGKSAATHLRLL
ncbi:cold-shock protein [Brevundimonas sp.]|uniref:cold-shock protein n=1 Tax=Brevundimonas sp. TaxID=1871086 RepID=UPI00289E4EBE|nr:cold-shock protein [Brevundimonas sp.]